ncbi:MAG: aminoacyl-tRNA hydrolase [Bacteroidales bacterium]
MKYLVVGLGNMGDQYVNTRHNIGFVVADAFARDGKATFSTGRYAEVARMKYRGKIIVLIKPSTLMNLSGKAVRYWLKKENVPVENMLVLVDDIALSTGILRMRGKGGDGGHNGLSSIIEYLGTTSFPRLRIGIGDEYPRGYQVDYVLGAWTRKEEDIMIPKIEMAVEMIKSFIASGLSRTMTVYNNQ